MASAFFLPSVPKSFLGAELLYVFKLAENILSSHPCYVHYLQKKQIKFYGSRMAAVVTWSCLRTSKLNYGLVPQTTLEQDFLIFTAESVVQQGICTA